MLSLFLYFPDSTDKSTYASSTAKIIVPQMHQHWFSLFVFVSFSVQTEITAQRWVHAKLKFLGILGLLVFCFVLLWFSQPMLLLFSHSDFCFFTYSPTSASASSNTYLEPRAPFVGC